MSKQTIFKSLCLILIVVSSSFQTRKSKLDSSVKILFTNELTADSLTSIRDKQKVNNIQIEYTKTTFDSLGKLTFISFDVTFKKSNHSSQLNIQDSSKVGFLLVDKVENIIKSGTINK